jgi:hypothetical protein
MAVPMANDAVRLANDAVRLAVRSRKALEKQEFDKKNENDNNCMVVVDLLGGDAKKTSLYKDYKRKLDRSGGGTGSGAGTRAGTQPNNNKLQK